MTILLVTSCGKEDRAEPAPAAKTTAVLADKSWPNVIVISVSSLRPDHLGCYGYSRKTSPHIDRLAREGALFENAISNTSWALPAHACMFTSLADSVHGCTDTERRLNDEHYTLAERLRDTGYATAGFFSGPCLLPLFGLHQGFETYVDCTMYPQAVGQSEGQDDRSGGEARRPAMDRDITSPRVVREVTGWLQANTRRPFFMFINLFDVHFDYNPPAPYDTMFDPDYTGRITGERFFWNPQVNPNMPKRDLEHLIALYDGEIAWTDEHVGRILAELERRELLDTSIIVLTSDHGTAFFEHGLKAHRNSLFDELIRIPLIIRYPAQIAAGQRHKPQVRMLDLLPTVLDMLGMRPAPLMGRSIAPLFAGGALAHDEPALSELNTIGCELQAYRRLDRKTIWHVKADKGVIYDLGSDPGELAPLTDKNAPLVELATRDIYWCRTFIQAFRERHPQSPQISELPDELLEQLRNLGYAEPAQPEQPSP
jgi:arylsulfatase A-like enzyme